MHYKISSGDVSIVVQGAIDAEYTKQCLLLARKYFPESEIILSTWEGSNVEGLCFDKVIFNNDPGGADCSSDGKGINNCNREIVSTFQGVKAASRRYVLKLRSDIILKSKKILEMFTKEYSYQDKYKVFKSRIVVCSIYSRRYFGVGRNILPALFHVSDWIYFGNKDDIYTLFDIPLTDEPTFSQWFRKRSRVRGRFEDTHKNRLWRFSPESYITLACFRKFFPLQCQDKLDISCELIRFSRNIIVNNFYIADQEQLCLEMPKYGIYQFLMPTVDRDGLYSNHVWQREYKKLCDKKYKVRPTLDFIMRYIVDIFKIQRRKR